MPVRKAIEACALDPCRAILKARCEIGKNFRRREARDFHFDVGS
jgi:hypothetical protein